MDNISKEKRSKIMRSIRGKDTCPEIAVRRLVYNMGYRYRLHRKDLPGKPDMAFIGRRKVIFIHGCFWHQHEECGNGHLPESNQSFWIPKFEQTKKRDAGNLKKIKEMGWQALVVWECELKNRDQLIEKLHEFFLKNLTTFE